MIHRVFVATQLEVNQKITLGSGSSWHILQVLRLNTGNPLAVFNNTGGEFIARIIGVEKQQIDVLLEKFIVRHNESSLSIHLGQGISRGEKMDFSIQKSVELGVTAITPLFTERCNVKLEGERLEKKLQHWRGIAISAAEQSGRCYVPPVSFCKTLALWCGTQRSKSVLRLVLDPYATTKLSSIKEHPQAVEILIGPEGGLSNEELVLAKANHFFPIALGPRILRTETAPLAIISVLQARWGDLG